MPRPFRTKIRDPKWWIEQVAHAALGGAVSGLFGVLSLAAPGHATTIYLLGVLSGAAAGAAREIIQNVDDDPCTNDVADSVSDSFFVTCGAVVGSMIWLLA